MIAGLWRTIDFLQTYNGAITALATVAIGIFTLVLAIVTRRQAILTKRSIVETKKAADAADMSAKAITVVERAYVYPIIHGHGAIEECIENALVFYLGDPTKDDVPADETTELTYRFKNFGRTPAILKNAFVGFGVAPLGAEIGVSIPESVLAALEETGPLVSQMQMGITKNQAQHILVYTGHVCFTGQITFDDIWGVEHTTRFYFGWDKDIRRMTLRGIETETKAKLGGE